MTLAKQRTVFLYLDPWNVAEINLRSLQSVASQINAVGSSVELLMNFNTPNFVRSALAALSQVAPPEDPETGDVEYHELTPDDSPSHERLTQIVGGDWWKKVIAAESKFHLQVKGVIGRVETSLRNHFAEVCWVGIKKKQAQLVPVYHMVFGSRHPHALELMNDAMVTARGESDFKVDLFAADELDQMILELASCWIRRGKLILKIIRRTFCSYYRSEIRARIEDILKEKKLESETGKVRINDSVRIRQRT